MKRLAPTTVPHEMKRPDGEGGKGAGGYRVDILIHKWLRDTLSYATYG